MKVETIVVKTIRISEIERLDPITLSIDDANGKLTVEVYGKSWSASWGSAQRTSVASFFLSCDNGYLVNCLDRGISSTITDFDEIPNYLKRLVLEGRRGCDFDAKVAREMYDSLENVSFENHEQLYHFRLSAISDWQHDLPTMINPDYNYLDRIVTAIKAAFALGETANAA